MGAAASSVERNESAHRGRGRDAGPMGCASSRLSSEKRSAAPQDPFKAADVQDGGSSGARHCNAFRDRFECIAAVQEALADGCFAPARLTFAIDLTKSNAWSGTRSFGGRNLHDLAADEANPYEMTIRAISDALEAFVPAEQRALYGFGDELSKGQGLLAFDGFQAPDCGASGSGALVSAYRQLLPEIGLAGPTNFAPAIELAVRESRAAPAQFGVLVIITDGQADPGRCRRATIQALLEASRHPISIVFVGVGDGPFDERSLFACDEYVAGQHNANCHFVNLHELRQQRAYDSGSDYLSARWEADLALAALEHVPDHLAAAQMSAAAAHRAAATPPGSPSAPIVRVHVAAPPPLRSTASFCSGDAGSSLELALVAPSKDEHLSVESGDINAARAAAA